MTTIDLVYFNAGGGHRAAAMALAESIAMRREGWRVRCVNLFDLLDPHGRFKRITGFAPEVYYNKRLANGWTIGLAQELKILQAMIRLGHRHMVRRLERHWMRTEPDIVASLIPNFNLALQASLGRALPGVPFVNILTDLADLPPHFWIEAPSGQHIICGTSHAADQARSMGHPAANVHCTSGMIIRPDFYTTRAFDRTAEFERLGLDASRPTGVVMFGGQGSMAMLRIAQDLDDVQLVLMCGRHAKLAASLRERPARAPRSVVEFTPDVRSHLALADFFIGKPGPGSLSEAVHMGLPIVTTLNAWTMPQERFNTGWVVENRFGVVAKSTASIRQAAIEVLTRLAELKRNVRRIENTAVFEVPRLLVEILDAEAQGMKWSSHGTLGAGVKSTTLLAPA